MDCKHVEEHILDAQDDAQPAPIAAEIAAHLAGCPACTAFAARQRMLDTRLAAMFPAPVLSPAIQQTVRARVRRNRLSVWRDSLPDLVHFVSGGLATLWCVVTLPYDAATVAGVGTIVIFVSYALLTTVRHSLEDIGLPDP
jgi:anti-sigma factor RsiW